MKPLVRCDAENTLETLNGCEVSFVVDTDATLNVGARFFVLVDDTGASWVFQQLKLTVWSCAALMF